ncbi:MULTISPECIES: hypothetical protein [Flavobacterium]|uniref:hypothetical protein n=1 Tax=Flavobacterium TaxID=237 RepID=UPI001FCC1ABA|nr:MULTISPECIES: hypothetical protein [Flavobacterium]UOK42143.1 hypothetical protein LZF87_12590 [Flavobacterium enshiense]
MSNSFLSYQHAINTINLLYKKSGFDFNEKTLGENIYKEFNIEIKNSKYASLFAYVDEYIVLLRIISQFYLIGSKENNKHSSTYYKITIRQIKHLSSIRLLCSYGLDTDARTILRLLYETSLVWTRCKLDIDFLEDYNNSLGFKESNEFWHKYIKSSKTEKFIKDEVSKRKLTWLGDLDDQISHMKTILSSTSHPSNLVDNIDFENDFNSDFLGVGKVSKSSHLTLSYAIMCTAMPFSLLPNPDDKFKILKNYEFKYLPINDKLNSSFEYYIELEKMFPVLFLMLSKFSNELNEKK